MPHIAYIGIGSNLGEREDHVARAVAYLRQLPDTRVTARATPMVNAPLGCPPGSPDFLNTVVELVTELEPRALMAALLGIERRMGRVRCGPRNAPRVIDLDLLLYDDVVMQSPSLTLPHPRMHERDFVLMPLMEIAPNALHPVLGLRVGDIRPARGKDAAA